MFHPLDFEETFFVAPKLCLFCGDKILTLTESYPGLPLWRDLPGGKISKSDRDKGVLFTLNREVQEELGIDLYLSESNTQLFHIEKRYEKTTRGDMRPFIFLCYIHRIDTQPSVHLTEHSSALWIQESEIQNLHDWRPGFSDIIKKAFAIKSLH